MKLFRESTLELSSYLPCSASDASREANTSRLFFYITAPLLTFTLREPREVPQEWTKGPYLVSLYLFGLIPIGRQAMVISYPPTDHAFCVRDNGHSFLISKWDHTVTIERSGNGTLYRDKLVIRAGFFTPFVTLFARVFFRHRQRRWRRLAADGFRY